MPDQFNKTLYVSRPKEQALFLEALANGYYLDIYGMTGLGKTEFLKWIHDSQKQHDYLCSYVDLAADDLDIYNLIAEQLFDETVFPDDPFAEFKEIAYSQTSLSEDETFNKGLQNILTTYKVVLCFDNIQATAATWQQFAEKVLESQHPTNLIVITTGQKPLQLAPKLRQRAKSVFLSYLTEKAVEEFIQRLSQVKGFNVDDDVVSDIFRLTQGHPLSIALLVELWTNGFERDLNAVNLPQGIDQLMQAVVENLILNQLQLGAGYPAPKDILQAIAPLRYILRSSQRDLLSKFLPDSFANKPPFFADRLFGEFQKVNLYDWKEGFGHSLNPVVRQILLEDMRLNARYKFIEIQKTLIEVYENLTGESQADNQVANLTEKLFHTAVLLTEEQTAKVEVSTRICGEMQNYFEERFVSSALLTDTDKQFISHLKEKLGNDTELGDLVVGGKTALLRVIDDFVKPAIHGIESALSQQLEAAYNGLKPEQQKIAEILFRNLSDRRRKVKLKEVANLANVSWRIVAEVVEVFCQAGEPFLSILPSADRLNPDSLLYISHENLIHEWQRLKKWNDEEAGYVKFYRRLENYACKWEKGKAPLLRPYQLEKALTWRTKIEELTEVAKWASRHGQHVDLTLRFLNASEPERAPARRPQARPKATLKENLLRIFKLVSGVVAIILSIQLATQGVGSQIFFVLLVIFMFSVFEAWELYEIYINSQKEVKESVLKPKQL
jgi:hypothetical protein